MKPHKKIWAHIADLYEVTRQQDKRLKSVEKRLHDLEHRHSALTRTVSTIHNDINLRVTD